MKSYLKILVFTIINLIYGEAVHGQYESILCHPCVQDWINTYSSVQIHQYLNASNSPCGSYQLIGFDQLSNLVTNNFDETNGCGINIQPNCDQLNTFQIYSESDGPPNCITNHNNFTYYSSSLDHMTNITSCDDFTKKSLFNLGEQIIVYTYINLEQDPLNFDHLIKVKYPDGSIHSFYSYDGVQSDGSPIPTPIQGGPFECHFFYWKINPLQIGQYTVENFVQYTDGTMYEYDNYKFEVIQNNFTIPTFTDVTPLIFNSIYTCDLVVGDINSDGFSDIYVSNYFLENNKNKDFELHNWFAGNDRSILSLSDVNKDGNLDLYFGESNLKYYNSNFNGYETFAFTKNTGPIGVTDFNNDGHLSVVTSNKAQNACNALLVLSDECDIFNYPTFECELDNALGNYYYYADMNNDQKMDILTGQNIISGIQGSPYTLESLPFRVFSMATADLNNDNSNDIVNLTTDNLSIKYGGSSVLLQIPNNLDHYGPVFLADMNNDGIMDILSNGIYFQKSDGSGFDFVNKFGSLQPNAIAIIHPIDYDNDGDLDIVTLDGGVQTPKLFRNESQVKNTKPEKPKSLNAAITNNRVDFSWSNGGNDLTKYPSYNLYVKNMTSGEVIYFPYSDTLSGYTKMYQKGNCEYNTGWFLKDLPAGKYRWKVQAIDQGYLGSEWAVGLDFEINTTSCDREIEMVQGITCIIPKDIQSGQLLEICENQSGQTLDYTIGKKYKIGYIDHPGCFSTCQQGHKVSVNCLEPINIVSGCDFCCLPDVPIFSICDDFEEGKSGLWSSNGSGFEAEVCDCPDGGPNHVFKFEGQDFQELFINQDFKEGRFAILEWSSFMIENNAPRWQIYTGNITNSSIGIDINDKLVSIYKDGVTTPALYKDNIYQVNNWNKFAVKFDTLRDSIIVYLNGKRITGRGDFGSNKIGKFTLESANANTEYLIDNVCFNVFEQDFKYPTDCTGIDPECTFKLSDMDVQVTDAACSKNNGSISLSLNPTNYSFSWSINNATSSVISLLSQGTYTITVTEKSTNCTDTRSFTIKDTKPFSPSAPKVTHPSCGQNNGIIELPENYKYTWEITGDTNRVRTMLGPSGIPYRVTITDISKTCSEVFSITLTNQNNLSVSGTVEKQPTCGKSNGEIKITEGYQYTWSDPTISGPNPKNLMAGSYTVTVTDLSSQCSDTLTFNLNNLDNLNVTGNVVKQPTCGKSNGEIKTTEGYQYTWSESTISGSNPKNLKAGQYTVTISDEGCSRTLEFKLEDYMPMVSFAPIQNSTISCKNNTPITIKSIVTAPGYIIQKYEWSDSNISGENATVYPSETTTYTVTITDENGCTATAEKIITVDKNKPKSSNTSQDSVITCKNTKLNLEASSDTSNPSYRWIQGISGNQKNVQVSNPGTYAVEVTNDDNGCKDTVSINIGLDTISPVYTIKYDSLITCKDSTSEITLVNTNVSNYTYEWNNNIVSNKIIVSEKGNYTVTVTDIKNGCSNQRKVSIKEDKNVPSAPDFEGILTCKNPDTLLIVSRDPKLPIKLSLLDGSPFKDSITYNDATAFTIVREFIHNGCKYEMDVVIIIDTTQIAGAVCEDGKFIQSDCECRPGCSQLKLKDDHLINPNLSGSGGYLSLPITSVFDQNKLTIMNRWGQKVYEKSPYISTNDEGWRGTFMNTGEQLPDGAYYYQLILTPDDKTCRFAGSVTVVR